MPKKRLIYTLLHNDGFFVQSRNFRRQRVGDLAWLSDIYGFGNISRSVDELVLLNVSADPESTTRFLRECSVIAESFFAPIAVGGGIRTVADARRAIEIGAEKIVVNALLDSDDDGVIAAVAEQYGRQSIIGSIDIKRDGSGGYDAYVEGGQRRTARSTADHIAHACALPVGEVMLGSIDQDGTGMGLDLDTLQLVPDEVDLPVVVCGGAGNQIHLLEALSHPRVDGVATANLLNFVGDGLERARAWLRDQNRVDLAHW